MALDIPEHKMAAYKLTAQKEWLKEQKTLANRRKTAWGVAHQAANILKKDFSATKVVVFGSLIQPQLFHLRSDIDLAVWGLAEKQYLRALAHLLSLNPTISVDLIRIEEASNTLQTIITKEGITLDENSVYSSSHPNKTKSN